jgi:ParB-like chromosome segregation protein Spo0J
VTQIEQIPPGLLVPYAMNARQHSDAQVSQIAGSIRAFGFNAPVLVDGENGIIAGHGRVRAALILGLDTVPCVRLVHLSESQRRAYILADNRIALSSTWDEAMLALELTDIRSDVDLLLTGFTEEEIAALIIDADACDLPDLPSGEKAPFQMMTFTLHDDQAETVCRAIEAAKSMGAFVDTGNENSNGNALARVSEMFLGGLQ